MDPSPFTIFLTLLFITISVSYLLVVRSIGRVKNGIDRMRGTMLHPDRTPPLSHSQWEIREKLARLIIDRAKGEFDTWAKDKSPVYGNQKSNLYFDMRVEAFMENVHTRSDMDIPPFFASIIGMEELQKLILEHEAEITAASISVMMGASCLFDCKGKNRQLKS